MRRLKLLVAAWVAGCAWVPVQAQAQDEREQVISAPGFADFLAVDGTSVWATNRGRVERWTREGKVTEVVMPKPCGAMAVTPGEMWLADCEQRTINRIDTRTAKLTATVHTGIAAPKGELSVVRGAGSVWVASDAKGVITRVNPRSGRIIGTVSVAPDTFYLTFAYGYLWAVSDSQQMIQKIDPRTNAVVKTTHLGLQSSFSAAEDGAIWVVEQGDGSVARVDAKSGEVTGRVKIGETLKFSDIDAGGGKVWVRTRAEQLFVVIDPRSLAIEARVGKVQGGGGLRYSPAGLWTSQHDVQLLSWWSDPTRFGK
jgi:DNA-binding beta-propeller fold protein YncE